MGRSSFHLGSFGAGENDGFCLPLVHPRRSFHRSSSSLALALSAVSLRKSFCYDKLAQVPYKLTIIKLDGSSFEVNVPKSATIADLKWAVQSVFSHLSTKGLDEISWQHVWGHFCLSYGGRKLLNDSKNVKDYGIKDGDELHFVRHISITYTLVKKSSRKQLDAIRPCTIPETTKDEEMQEVDQDNDDQGSPKYQQYNCENIACRSIQAVSYESSATEISCQPYRTKGGLIGYFRSFFHRSDKRLGSNSSRVSH